MGAQELHGQTGRGRQAEATQQQRMRQLSRRRQNRFGLCAQEPSGLDDDDDDDDVNAIDFIELKIAKQYW